LLRSKYNFKECNVFVKKSEQLSKKLKNGFLLKYSSRQFINIVGSNPFNRFTFGKTANQAMKYYTLLLIMGLLIVACKSSKDLNDPSVKVPFNNKVMVTLKPSTTIDQLEKEFVEYSLKSRGLTSKSSNKAMFVFDDTMISNAGMLKLLNKSKMVVKAERMQDAATKTTTIKSSKKSTSRPTK